MTSSPQTLDEYIASLPDERRDAVATVREMVRQNLPAGFEEGIQYGAIGWYVPLERFPDTYNGEPLALAGLANRKGYVALYLNNVYGNTDTERWFRERYAASGKKLDMGKSCIRFKRVEDLPLGLIGETIARTDLDSYLAHYAAVRGSSRQTRET